MDGLDDYFDYAMDLDEAGRSKLMARLRKEEPLLAERLHTALTEMVTNPDFLCQRQPAPRADGEPDRLLASTLRVGDVDRAVSWYTEHFRCEVVRQQDDEATLVFGASRLTLRRWDEERPAVTIVSPDVASLGPSHRRSDGARALLLTDPWGNAVEVVDRVPGEQG